MCDASECKYSDAFICGVSFVSGYKLISCRANIRKKKKNTYGKNNVLEPWEICKRGAMDAKKNLLLHHSGYEQIFPFKRTMLLADMSADGSL